MENQELRKHLQTIQDEIQKAGTVDEKGAQLLHDLDQDLHDLLARSEETPLPVQDSLVDRMQGTLYHFEATHPSLTTAISKFLTSLSSSGI